ncbi:MAG TPA: phage tail terminator-like protein [Planctomycetota bacterium]|nr:phage tail terminator-like protein [Planctomycetota bacterium]
MTSWQAMADAVRSRFKTLVEDVVPIPTEYDNHAFTPPANAPWARWAIQPAVARQLEMGAASARTFRTDGRAVASIFVPEGLGDQAALVVADVVSLAFRAQTASGVTYRSPVVKVLGRSGKWWQVNVECPFYIEDLG